MIEVFRSLLAPPRDLILVVAALWIGLALAEKRSERRGILMEVLSNLVLYGILGFITGGRLLYALANYSAFSNSPLSLFSLNIDLFDPASGLLTAILAGFIYGRRLRLPLWGALDALTPILATLAIGLHLSHFAAGTAFGSPTDLPWGIHLWNATRHPSQIYELIASLIIFSLVWFRDSDPTPGALFLKFLACTAGSRLFFEAFRGDSTVVLNTFRVAQILAWLILALSLIALESKTASSKAS